MREASPAAHHFLNLELLSAHGGGQMQQGSLRVPASAEEEVGGEVAILGPGVECDVRFGEGCGSGYADRTEAVHADLDQSRPGALDGLQEGRPNSVRVVQDVGGGQPAVDDIVGSEPFHGKYVVW